jgi:hypothetical protein
MSKCEFNHLYGWDPRLRLRRPTSVLVIKCTTFLTWIENSYLDYYEKQFPAQSVFRCKNVYESYLVLISSSHRPISNNSNSN